MGRHTTTRANYLHKPEVAEQKHATDARLSVPLESIVCTHELARRPARSPDYQTETGALASLSQALADSAGTILQTLAETILATFQCGSAGVSILSADGSQYHWAAVAGLWKPHTGLVSPRQFGPCGDVLDRNASLLFAHFERRYHYLKWATPLIDECLTVPMRVAGKPVGTIWAITHDDHRRFDSEDLRMLDGMSRFVSSAQRVVESLR